MKEDIHDGAVDKGESESNEGWIACSRVNEMFSKEGLTCRRREWYKENRFFLQY